MKPTWDTDATPAKQKMIDDLRRDIDISIERQMFAGFGDATTSTVASTAKPLTALEILAQAEAAVEAARKTHVTVAVHAEWEGKPLLIKNAGGGKTIWCDYHTAAILHQDTPLRLVRVHSARWADFDVAWPATSRDERRPLPAPPFGPPVTPSARSGSRPRPAGG